MKNVFIFLLLIAALPVYAETTGTINFSDIFPTTGLFAYSVKLCNVTADCFGYACFSDYDGTSEVPSSGLCNLTANTYCFHNGYGFASAASVCVSNVTYRTCSSGAWSNLSTCAAGQTCTTGDLVPGSCSTPSSSSSSSSGLTSANTTAVASISLTTYPADFELVQGNNQSKSLVVKNTGNKTLNNITVSISGFNWYSLIPSKISQLLKGNDYTFSIIFNPPADATGGSYTVTISVVSAEVSISKSFVIKVNISEQTIQQEIIPDVANFTLQLESINANITSLENRGVDVSVVKNMYVQARNKIAEAKTLIESKDYASAALLIDEARGLIDIANAGITELEEQAKFKFEPIMIVYAVIVLGVVGFIVYMFLPPKQGGKKTLYELLEDHENTFIEKLKRRMKKNEHKNEHKSEKR